MSVLKDILRKKPTLLVERMQDFIFKQEQDILSGKLDAADVAMEEFRLCAEHFKRVLAQYAAREKRSRTGGKFHPSQISGCMRAIWFGMMNAPTNCIADKVSVSRGISIFGNGDYVHLRIQNLLTKMGVLKQREVPLEDKSLNVEGHADGILDIPAVLEIKSINDRGFAGLIAPKPNHVEQANMYMHCLKINKTVFIYENKNTQEWKEFVTNFDGVLFAKQKQRIGKIAKAVASQTMPDKEEDDYACKWCAYSATCADPKFKTAVLNPKAAATVEIKKIRKPLAIFMRK